jgi:hypothetical protein
MKTLTLVLVGVGAAAAGAVLYRAMNPPKLAPAPPTPPTPPVPQPIPQLPPATDPAALTSWLTSTLQAAAQNPQTVDPGQLDAAAAEFNQLGMPVQAASATQAANFIRAARGGFLPPTPNPQNMPQVSGVPTFFHAPPFVRV